MDLLKNLNIDDQKYFLYENEVEEFVKAFIKKYPSFAMGQKVLEDQLANEFVKEFPELIKH